MRNFNFPTQNLLDGNKKKICAKFHKNRLTFRTSTTPTESFHIFVVSLHNVKLNISAVYGPILKLKHPLKRWKMHLSKNVFHYFLSCQMAELHVNKVQILQNLDKIFNFICKLKKLNVLKGYIIIFFWKSLLNIDYLLRLNVKIG